ncbi:MAG: hypothetical protein A3G75_14580 [Verrucomicrobia bacterium RIFCSPLOWO2_12_FULL_64_8]|nr:MAG: hypothetical protein A3G75_14580 [Verrucomicrobia bacterium RIFCSPLOWO2_12_FULL_64_8]
MWGHQTGSHNSQYGLSVSSRMSPVEAAHYMGIPNMIMVRYGGADPFPPDRQYLVPFRGLRRVVWSVAGGGVFHSNDAVDRALEVSSLLPNVNGVMMDDFFRRGQQDAGVLSLAELQGLRERLSQAGRPLDIWVVLYDHQLDLPVGPHLALCDKVTFWTWQGEGLAGLEENFNRLERLVPEARRRVLGCYMWDYGQKRPMPLKLMELQCELGLRWLKERRIDGMIFLASCICDLDLDAVEWTRTWVQQVGDRAL